MRVGSFRGFLFCQRFNETRSSHFANVFSWGLGRTHQRDPDREAGTEHFGVKMHCSPKSEESIKIPMKLTNG